MPHGEKAADQSAQTKAESLGGSEFRVPSYRMSTGHIRGNSRRFAGNVIDPSAASLRPYVDLHFVSFRVFRGPKDPGSGLRVSSSGFQIPTTQFAIIRPMADVASLGTR